MTQDIGEHLNKLTSRNGRYWLRDSRAESASRSESTSIGESQSQPSVAADQLPFQSLKRPLIHPADQQGRHESVVVSIPDVAALNAKAAGVPTTAATQASAVATTSHDTAHRRTGSTTRTTKPAPKIHRNIPEPQTSKLAKQLQPDTTLADAATISRRMPNHVPHVADVESTPTPAPTLNQQLKSTATISEALERAVPTTTQTQPTQTEPTQNQPPTQDTLAGKAETADETEITNEAQRADDAVHAARASQTESSTDSIAKIADEIVSKHPLASSSVIMIAGSQASMHSDETCARVAAELASRNLGRILLIDSDFTTRRLTKASGMGTQGGLSEVMNIAYPWQKAILKSGSSKLDFMAAGSCPHKRWTPKETLREAIAEIRSEYQFVCISVGDAHSSASSLWSEMSDGALLVVSATQSSDAVAESAVQQMRDDGARLIGCIVADVDVEKQPSRQAA